MKKIGAIMICLLLVGACILTGCVEETGKKPSPSPTTKFTLADAIMILMSKILIPSSSYDRSSAFLMSQVLRTGDTVKSEDGISYSITNNTWFVFIDDDPEVFFAHPTRYVFIDAEDGSYDIVNEEWPPFINDVSMWDAITMNRGNLIEIYPILNSSLPINTDESNAPIADYGDAPDGQFAYYQVEGHFPTLYNTTNSKLDRPGGHAIIIGQEILGKNVSAEEDANDPNDPDDIPNLVDSDNDERMFVILNGLDAQLCFDVTIDANAPDVIRYANILIDLDQDGNWTNGLSGIEWVVENLEVNVTPGTIETIITPSFSWGNDASDLPSSVWSRVALTREQINETLFAGVGGWDGSGEFQYGEIEDHLIYLIDNPPDPDDEWPPENGNGGGGQPPGPTEGPCGSEVNYHSLIISGGDSSKHMKKGQKPAQKAVDTMTELLNDQGYNSIGALGPAAGGSKNSIKNIEAAFETLKSQVKCGDHVLIYIVGHGNKATHKNGPGINLKGSDGGNDELLTPSKLATLLAKIQACKDEKCDEEQVNCHLRVVIESCYAGNFNTPGVTGLGRTIMGSCDDEPADASGGGIFTSGFNSGSRSLDGDVNDDKAISPSEAYQQAESAVEKNNDKPGRKNKEAQEPWIDSQECECKCPATPSISCGKYVWDGIAWADEATILLGESVQFRYEIENTGSTKNVQDLIVTEIIPLSLSYESANLHLNGEILIPQRDPCTMIDVRGGLQCTWYLTEIPYLAPGDIIGIDLTATTLTDGTITNTFSCSGYCSTDTDVLVECNDSATVFVQPR